MPGPDFPTGGLIMGKKGILDAYETGHGNLTIRAKCEIEEKEERPRLHCGEGNSLPGEPQASAGKARRAGARQKLHGNPAYPRRRRPQGHAISSST